MSTCASMLTRRWAKGDQKNDPNRCNGDLTQFQFQGRCRKTGQPSGQSRSSLIIIKKCTYAQFMLQVKTGEAPQQYESENKNANVNFVPDTSDIFTFIQLCDTDVVTRQTKLDLFSLLIFHVFQTFFSWDARARITDACPGPPIVSLYKYDRRSKTACDAPQHKIKEQCPSAVPRDACRGFPGFIV